MQVIDRDSKLWTYLSEDIRGLLIDGEDLIDHAMKHGGEAASDFSYLVFPFAKSYEGFLKKLFLDLDLIQEDEYYGDDIRIGRILNPHFMKENKNIFGRLSESKHAGHDTANLMWDVWKKGRNQVFHYFPHNFRRLSYGESIELIQQFVQAMHAAVASCPIC